MVLQTCSTVKLARVATGVYLARLESGTKQATAKVVLR